MKPFGILGHIEIPDRISDLVPEVRAAWQESGRLVWELPRRRPWQLARDRAYLDETTSNFISDALDSLDVVEYDEHGHSLLLFGNVSKHDDGPVLCNERPAAFFHLILSGSGTLRLPGLRDKQLREVALSKGLAFWFNPRIKHLVENASDDGLASLTATIRPAPSTVGPRLRS